MKFEELDFIIKALVFDFDGVFTDNRVIRRRWKGGCCMFKSDGIDLAKLEVWDTSY